MTTPSRREFIGQAAAVLGAGWASTVFARSPEGKAAASVKPRISDTVVLGKTGIRTSRVAIGTGTDGGQQQRNLGTEGLVRLLRYAHDEGVRWWDTADMYRTHPFHARTLKEIRRDEVVITTKTRARDAAGVRADIERFRRELDTDYIDIVLLHCIERTPNWTKKLRGCMDVLSEAKEKGWIRAHGCSCHDLAALKEAAEEPWVEVDLARFNPFAEIMDVSKPEDLGEVEKTLERMHARGGAVYAMKVIGNGRFKGDQIEQSLRYALSKPYITALNIGFTSPEQIDDIARRFESMRVG